MDNSVRKDILAVVYAAEELLYRVKGITKADEGYSELTPEENLEAVLTQWHQKYDLGLNAVERSAMTHEIVMIPQSRYDELRMYEEQLDDMLAFNETLTTENEKLRAQLMTGENEKLVDDEELTASEVVEQLTECVDGSDCDGCPFAGEGDCVDRLMLEAADIITELLDD